MVLRAVALEVPDWEGAMDGTNPSVLLADQSERSVGAVLMQLPARKPGAAAIAPRGSLRMLAVWSKLLNERQSRWTVWEGELFTIR